MCLCLHKGVNSAVVSSVTLLTSLPQVCLCVLLLSLPARAQSNGSSVFDVVLVNTAVVAGRVASTLHVSYSTTWDAEVLEWRDFRGRISVSGGPVRDPGKFAHDGLDLIILNAELADSGQYRAWLFTEDLTQIAYFLVLGTYVVLYSGLCFPYTSSAQNRV